ncbi:hypothetical protein O181_008307 [Austropuccinia psidii MF-1]|uniref:Reverse transcriptase RNase H-like domain-containing protein n=1 Tax=Austropuccinia psidii MF-1 TaxID=1389203 RepID=A0A9Q3BNJ4_9BASI|nr:hypothetical protein [Austropuccinia psidii MF-1]
MQSLLGLASYCRNHIENFSHITSSLYKLCSKDIRFEITKERRDAYERIKNELTNAPVLILPDFELPFKLYIHAACSQGLGEALHQRQIVDGEPREGVICYISRKLKDPEARYRAIQTECLFLAWALEKLHYYMEGEVFEFYTECTALKSLLNMKTTNRHNLHWKIAIQEYRGNMNTIYKEGTSHTNADGLRRLPLNNVKRKPPYDPESGGKTSDFLNGHQKGVPQTGKTLNQKEQKLLYWDKLLRTTQYTLHGSNYDLFQTQTVWHIVSTPSTEIKEPITGIPVRGALVKGL